VRLLVVANDRDPGLSRPFDTPAPATHLLAEQEPRLIEESYARGNRIRIRGDAVAGRVACVAMLSVCLVSSVTKVALCG
jgi:hypothetical protein